MLHSDNIFQNFKLCFYDIQIVFETNYVDLQEKGKYEVIVGMAKVADDLVEFWSELLTRYPSIIAIIDPMRKQVNY